VANPLLDSRLEALLGQRVLSHLPHLQQSCILVLECRCGQHVQQKVCLHILL
jgi:hypothetical protein